MNPKNDSSFLVWLNELSLRKHEKRTHDCFIESVVFRLNIACFKWVFGVRDLLFEDKRLRMREVVDYLTRTSGAAASSAVAYPTNFMPVVMLPIWEAYAYALFVRCDYFAVKLINDCPPLSSDR